MAVRIYGWMSEREGERERGIEKEKAREKGRHGRGRKGVCRGAHDFLHILRWLLSAVEDNQAATTSPNDSG